MQVDSIISKIEGRIAQIEGKFDELFPRPASKRARSSASASAGALQPLPGEITDLVRDTAVKYGIDPGLFSRLVHAESGGNTRSVSSVGALGLTQLMPGTAAALGVDDAFDPVENLDGGARYLKQLMDRFGDTRLAVAAYNAGPGAVKRYNGVPPFAETQAFVKKVLGE